jgi:Tfp pilus assembly protein PilN
MIQFNLLPDVKIEFIKAQRTKRLVMGVSFIAGAVALFIFLFLIVTVDVWQKKSINDLSKDIASNSTQLKQTPNLTKILTVQSQLNSIDTLHDANPVGSRVFGYMNQLTPLQVQVSGLDVDFTASTISVTGTAPSLDVVNSFVDNLKYTTYTTTDSNQTMNAFSSVILSSFGRDSTGASFTITASFDPAIFSNSSQPTLTVNGTAAAAQSSFIYKLTDR